MRTAIDLPDSLYREAKTRAVQKGMKFKDLVAQCIKQGLQGQPLPVFCRTGGAPIPARTNANLFEILQEEETRYKPQL